MFARLKNGFRACAAFIQPMPTIKFSAAVNKNVAKAQAKAPDSLAKVMASELQFEKQRYNEFKEGEEFLKQTGFSLVESPDSVEIKLMKNAGDKVVEIRYQASEPVNEKDEEETEEENKEKKEGEDEKDNIKTVTDFTVLVKNKDGSGLIFDCTTQETDLNVYHVAYSKNVEEMLKSIDRDNKSYMGPSFENLDEKVQQSFVEYLESLGISDKLLAYIECSSIDKEQKMYMNWLNDIKEFIEPSHKQ